MAIRSKGLIVLVVGLIAAALVAVVARDGTANPPAAFVGIAPGSGGGALIVTNTGEVVSIGGASTAGSLTGVVPTDRIVDLAETPGGAGYWVVGDDGGVFALGDARFMGSMGGTRLNQPVVAIDRTESGAGYRLAASDGGIFTFGDAPFLGSMGGTRLNQPIVGIASVPGGRGYWLVAADGGVFSFGDAQFYGSMGGTRLNQPIVGMAATPTGRGYWLAAADGGIFTFGDAQFLGTTTGEISGITDTADAGYQLVDRAGSVTTFKPGVPPVKTPPIITPAPTTTTTTTSPGGGGSPPPSGGSTQPVAGDVIVSPTGSGTGSASSPARLSTALSGGVRVDAGDTIWLRGGTYRGAFTTGVSGSASQPITIRSYPGEWAVLDGAGTSGAGSVLQVNTGGLVVRDLEITDSDTNRGPQRPTGVNVVSADVKLVNLVVHDTGNGISVFTGARNVEIYGSIVYNNGSTSPANGHSIYVANAPGSTRRIEDSVWFGGYRSGVHAYAVNGRLYGIEIIGNVGDSTDGDILGGEVPIEELTLVNNDLEHVRLGYSSDNTSARVEGNRFGWTLNVGDFTDETFQLDQDWQRLTFRENTVYGSGDDGFRLEDANATPRAVASATWDSNHYYSTRFAYPNYPGHWPQTGVDFATWQRDLGWDANGTWASGLPPSTVQVRPNRYESGRAMVVARNFAGAGQISFDPTSFLVRGARYEIRNAFNYTAGPVATGTWNGGSISVAMSGLGRAPRIGESAALPSYAPRIGVFIVRTVG